MIIYRLSGVIVSFRKYLLYNNKQSAINIKGVIVSFRKYLLYNNNAMLGE